MSNTARQYVCEDYRTILQEELASRCQQNPRYSLRAFARDLELAPSRLSEVLSGKQGLSREVAQSVARKLGYSKEYSEYFCDLVDSSHARRKSDKAAANLRLLQYRSRELDYYTIPLDAFKIISEWYHLAIVELTKLPGFKDQPQWIAKKLGIQPIQAELALERLLRLKILQRVENRLVACEWITPDVPSEHIRKFHRQILEKAMSALGTQSIEKRDFSTSIIPVAQGNLRDAKESLAKFQYEFCKTYGEENDDSSVVPDAVYCLSVQFFSLTEN